MATQMNADNNAHICKGKSVMVLNRFMLVFIFMFLFFNSGLHGSSCYYVIKKGDTLTNILKNFGVNYIGRKKIKVMTASNFPTILKKGDLIYPKTVISIPKNEVNKNKQRCLHASHEDVIARTQEDCPEIKNQNQVPPFYEKLQQKTVMNSRSSDTSASMDKSSVRTEFSAGATWSRLDGTDKRNNTEGSFLNELSPNYSLDIAYRFSERFEIIASAGLTYYLFEEAPSGSFINDTRFLADFFGVGVRYLTNSWGKISLHISRRGELNYIVPVINNIDMSVDHVFPIRLQYEIDLLAKSLWDLSLSGKAEYFFGDVVEKGYGFQLGAKIGYRFLQSAIHLNAHWHQQSKESDFLDIEHREIISSLSYSYFMNGGSY